MSNLRVPTLDVPVFRARVEKARARLQALALDHDGPRLARIVHDAVAAGLAEEAVQRMRAVPGASRCPEFDWAFACALWEAGDRASVVATAHGLLAQAQLDPLHARIVVRAAWADLLRGEEDPLLVPALQAIRARVRDEQGPTAVVADLAHLDAYRDLVQSARVERAREGAALAAEIYRSLDEPVHECKARVLLARIDAIGGRLPSAVDDARRATERALDVGHPHLVVLALNALGTASFRRGEWREAELAYARALELAEGFGERRWQLAVRANLARLQAWRGHTREAERELVDLMEDVQARHARSVFALLLEYRGQARLIAGDAVGALECFEACERELDRSGVASYERSEIGLRRAEALLELDQPDQALLACDAALARLESTGQCLERGHLMRVRARAAHAMGRPSEAREGLERAEAWLRRVGDRYELARCLLDRAQLLDDPIDARLAWAHEAQHLAVAIGLATLVEAARDVASELASMRRHRGAEREIVRHAGVVAASESMRTLLDEAQTAASSDAPVLIQGETGTGKEVVARFVHDHSSRAARPFVAVNCAAIPESLFEREFFGHVRGAYTGADRDTAGLVEAADGGTLFLDEIGEMPASLQPKLLRLLQEGTFRRVGDTAQRSVDLRIVAATNRSLFDLARQGQFREDLYWRLSWFELGLRPLRERADDVVELVKLFLARESTRTGQHFWLDRDAWQVVREHDWPGNARQLESAIASACARAASVGHEDGCVRREDLPMSVRGRRAAARMRARGELLDLQASLSRHERELILDALQRSHFRRAEAARLLGIGRNTLYEKMRKLGIRPEPAARSV